MEEVTKDTMGFLALLEKREKLVRRAQCPSFPDLILGRTIVNTVSLQFSKSSSLIELDF